MVGMDPETPNAGDLPLSVAASQLLANAQSEADCLQHEHVGTEHLLQLPHVGTDRSPSGLTE